MPGANQGTASVGGRDAEIPAHLTRQDDGTVRDHCGVLYEQFEGRWCEVKNGGRDGWWRFHSHYDRDGYCDNPGRGY
jgi:hypothetical protein